MSGKLKNSKKLNKTKKPKKKQKKQKNKTKQKQKQNNAKSKNSPYRDANEREWGRWAKTPTAQ